MPVGFVARAPFFVMVHPSVEAKTLPELIALEKAKPGSLSVATDGQRNFSGMLTAWLGKLGGVNFTQVPYTAMPQGIQDAVAGRVQVVILALPHRLRRSWRAINCVRVAGSCSGESAGLRQVYAGRAVTYPGFDFIGWFVLAAPAGTPDAIVRRLNRELDAVLKDPEVMERMQKAGFYSEGAGTPEQTARLRPRPIRRLGAGGEGDRAGEGIAPSHSGATRSGEPESMTTVAEYGFRFRAFAGASRNSRLDLEQPLRIACQHHLLPRLIQLPAFAHELDRHHCLRPDNPSPSRRARRRRSRPAATACRDRRRRCRNGACAHIRSAALLMFARVAGFSR